MTPRTGDRFLEMIRKVVIVLLVLAAGFCLYRGVSPYLDVCMDQKRLINVAYMRKEDTVLSESEIQDENPNGDFNETYVSPINFEVLKSINPDIIGWIKIPGTVIDYPICWRAGDNEYYMTHTATGEVKPYGAIMMDGSNSPEASDRLVVLYGHHMKNGTMFREIVKYSSPDFLYQHRAIQLYFPDHEELYTVIGTVVCQAKDMQVGNMISDSNFVGTWDNGVLKELDWQDPIERVLALVTCSYGSEDERTICFAVPGGSE